MKIKLKKIDLSKRDDCNHPDIFSEKEYLAVYDGKKIIGKFHKVWYGWNFNWVWSAVAGIQLDGLTEVYEIIFTE